MPAISVSRKDIDKFRNVDEPGIFTALIKKMDDKGEISQSGKSNVYKGMLEITTPGPNEGILIGFLFNDSEIGQQECANFCAACDNQTIEEFFPEDPTEKVDLNFAACVGKEVGVEVNYRPHEGKRYNNIREFFPVKLATAKVPFGV